MLRTLDLFIRKTLAAFLLVLSFCLYAQNGFCSGLAAIVDIEKVLIQSNAAHLGREHIKAVRNALEQGYTQLQQSLAKLPEQQRQKEMQDAAKALNQQLELERNAVNRVITQMMMEEIKSYRIKNKLELVLPKQVILDADAGIDITNQIIKAMNTKNPVFGKLPVVQVRQPPETPKVQPKK